MFESPFTLCFVYSSSFSHFWVLASISVSKVLRRLFFHHISFTRCHRFRKRRNLSPQVCFSNPIAATVYVFSSTSDLCFFFFFVLFFSDTKFKIILQKERKILHFPNFSPYCHFTIIQLSQNLKDSRDDQLGGSINVVAGGEWWRLREAFRCISGARRSMHFELHTNSGLRC